MLAEVINVINDPVTGTVESEECGLTVHGTPYTVNELR